MSDTDRMLAVCAICGGGSVWLTHFGVWRARCECELTAARNAYYNRLAMIGVWDDVQDELAQDFADAYNAALPFADAPGRMRADGLREWWEGERRKALAGARRASD